jgi:hypothetical protein
MCLHTVSLTITSFSQGHTDLYWSILLFHLAVLSIFFITTFIASSENWKIIDSKIDDKNLQKNQYRYCRWRNLHRVTTLSTCCSPCWWLVLGTLLSLGKLLTRHAIGPATFGQLRTRRVLIHALGHEERWPKEVLPEVLQQWWAIQRHRTLVRHPPPSWKPLTRNLPVCSDI